MEFREFFEQEEAKLFDEGLEQIDEVLGSALRFIGGAGGNFVSQTARGIGNLATGVGQSAIGTGQGVLSALQAAGGGWEKRGKKTLDDAFSNTESGGRKFARGAAQLAGALTTVTPLLRGAQAASEPMRLSGVYAPNSKNRTATQDVFGLDSWEKPEPSPKPKSAPKSKQTQKPHQKAPKPESEQSTSSFLRDLEKKEKTKDQPEAWVRLVAMYRSARTSEEKKEIRRRMRLVSPYLYQQAIDRGRAKLKKLS